MYLNCWNAGSRIPEGSTPVHAAGYGCTVRLLRRLVELGGDVRLHDVNGLMVRHWAARQLNVSRRSKNLTYLLYAQNRALASVGRPPVDVQPSSALPSVTASVQQRPMRSSSTFVDFFLPVKLKCSEPCLLLVTCHRNLGAVPKF